VNILALGPLGWAAVGKDPGFAPLSRLELPRRRGRVRPEDLARLHLVGPVDVQALKAQWLAALEGADAFVRRRPPEEAGCLYYAPAQDRFVDPENAGAGGVVPHYAEAGGVLPRILESDG
jgi:hypothetical protein